MPFNNNENKIPVYVITGFLGAGKTTLLNHLLTNPNGKKFAVIVNEFGEIGIDNDLVVGADEEVFELNNGCICCNVRGDLIRILGSLFKRKSRFDAIIVETTGLANPAPVAQTFFADDDIARKSYLASIVTVVDAVHILENLDEYEEARNQIGYADLIILNKISEVDAAQKQKCIAAIRQMNSGIEIIETDNSNVDFGKIIGKSRFSPEILNEENLYFNAPKEEHHHDCHDEHCDHPHHHHHHDHDHHHEHNHYDGVEAIALQSDKKMSEEKFTAFLSKIIDLYGAEMLRFKGIIDIEGQNRQYIFNGVHMMVEADYGNLWENKKRYSRMVIIGKNLPKDLLTSGFLSSVAM